jgi:hypothetical protein
VNRRLKQFVCVRLDHEQMQRLSKQGRLVVPTQGNQVLLDPQGNYIPGIEPRGRRYPVEKLIELLDQVLERHPARAETGDAVKLEWFLWNVENQGLRPYFGASSVARLDRKPLLTLSGELPDWLDRPELLGKHLRQFIWTRGSASGAGRISIVQLEPERRELASFDLGATTPEELSRILDAAWLAYMKERPLVARGYIDNPHGNWLRGVMEKVAEEEQQVRRQAEAGTLAPPGR